MNDQPDIRTSRCPQCGCQFKIARVDEPRWLPFCSSRCQCIDLGNWLNGEYRISREIKEADIERTD